MGVVSNAVSLALPSLLVLLCLVMKTSLAELERLEHQTRREDSSLNFLVVGDWGRKGSFNQSNVAFQMGRIGEKLDIDFVISTGDNFYSNGLSGVEDPTFYESFKNIYTPKSLQKPWYTILGNHDYRGNVSAQISPLLRDIDDRWFCYRSFLLSSEFVDFIFVDTTPFVNEYFTKPKKNIYDWSGVTPQDKYIADLLEDVETALKKSSGKWKIVIGHHTIRSAGPVGDTIELVEKLLPILEVYNVDFFINGHEHCLQHISPTTNGIKFLTSGGGSKTKKSIAKEVDGLKFYHDGQGFMSMEMKKNEVRIVFYDVYGYSLHHFNLYKQPNIPLSMLGMCPANNEIVGMCFGNNAVEK